MINPIQPAQILAVADAIVQREDRFAALPSTDIMITATVRAICEALNQVLAPFFDPEPNDSEQPHPDAKG